MNTVVELSCESCGSPFQRQRWHHANAKRDWCGVCARREVRAKCPELPRLPDVWWAWLAGFFDGEGSCVKHSTRNRISLSISQKDRRPLLEIAERLGGRVHKRNSDGCSKWVTTNPYLVLFVLDEMYPHLRLKGWSLDWALGVIADTAPPGDKIHKFIRRRIRHTGTKTK